MLIFFRNENPAVGYTANLLDERGAGWGRARAARPRPPVFATRRGGGWTAAVAGRVCGGAGAGRREEESEPWGNGGRHRYGGVRLPGLPGGDGQIARLQEVSPGSLPRLQHGLAGAGATCFICP